MKTTQTLTLAALAAAQASAIPLDGLGGGLLVQHGMGNTMLDMHYDHLPSILEKAAQAISEAKSSDEDKSDDNNDHEHKVIIATDQHQVKKEDELLVFVERVRPKPEWVMPGLAGLFGPQRPSPPPLNMNPLEQAMKMVERLVGGLEGVGGPSRIGGIKEVE